MAAILSIQVVSGIGIALCQSKHLDKIVEQDHQAIEIEKLDLHSHCYGLFRLF